MTPLPSSKSARTSTLAGAHARALPASAAPLLDPEPLPLLDPELLPPLDPELLPLLDPELLPLLDPEPLSFPPSLVVSGWSWIPRMASHPAAASTMHPRITNTRGTGPRLLRFARFMPISSRST